jgi:hypothetical protein
MAPRPLFALLILSLSGCAQQPVQTSLCGMGPEFRTWQGTVVRIKAMLVAGGEEGPPMIVDMRCWRGIAADFSDMSESIKILDAPGRFNKFAQVSGQMRQGKDGRMWLHVTDVADVRIEPPKGAAAEDAFFNQMLRERNAYFQR